MGVPDEINFTSDYLCDDQGDVPVSVVVAHCCHPGEHQGGTTASSPTVFTDVAASAASASEQSATASSTAALQRSSCTACGSVPGRPSSVTAATGTHGYTCSSPAACLAAACLAGRS